MPCTCLVLDLMSWEMEVLILIMCLFTVSTEFVLDLKYLEDFIHEKKYLLKKKYRSKYHIYAPVGWLNNPAGFIYFKRKYHIFYQYFPYDVKRDTFGPLHWGHVISDNFVDWVFYPHALAPDKHYDSHGCLSGSTVVYNRYLTLFYTGNYLVNNRRVQSQNVAVSGNGIVFQKYLYNAVLRDGPYGRTDFRNPKVWRFRNSWYMLVGTSRAHEAYLLLYSSPDSFNWRLNGTVAKSFGDMGHMWENPDLFEIDGYYVLMLSVQGIRNESRSFQNLCQTGYVVGTFDYWSLRFEDLDISTSTFNELDFGHDFYAAKTMKSSDGRRLLVAWLGTWSVGYQETNTRRKSTLTLVRELRLSSLGKLLMTPVREVADLRTELLEEAWYSPGENFVAGTRAFELIINSSSAARDAAVLFEWMSSNRDRQYLVNYSAEQGEVSVNRGGIDGYRKADWRPLTHVYWQIFVDHCSIEVFCGAGEVVFSSRIYPKRSMRITVLGKMRLHITLFRLRRSVRYDNSVYKQFKLTNMNASILF